MENPDNLTPEEQEALKDYDVKEELKKRITTKLADLPDTPDSPLFNKLKKDMQNTESELFKSMEKFAKSLIINLKDE